MIQRKTTNNKEMTKNYVTPREASRILGVCDRTLRYWEEQGKIKAIRTAGGQRRYDITTYITKISPEPIPNQATNKLPLEDPHQWIRQLRRKLIEGDGMNHVQETLREFSFQLPAIIERIAATSQRTELEISLEILDRIATALQNTELISE